MFMQNAIWFPQILNIFKHSSGRETSGPRPHSLVVLSSYVLIHVIILLHCEALAWMTHSFRFELSVKISFDTQLPDKHHINQCKVLHEYKNFLFRL